MVTNFIKLKQKDTSDYKKWKELSETLGERELSTQKKSESFLWLVGLETPSSALTYMYLH